MLDIWLDDERDPANHGFAGARWFKTGEELVAWLEENGCAGIRTLSLDHDLGSGRMTGYDVITRIETAVATGASPPRHIALHTQNPVGKERMRAARASIYRMATGPVAEASEPTPTNYPCRSTRSTTHHENARDPRDDDKSSDDEQVDVAEHVHPRMP